MGVYLSKDHSYSSVTFEFLLGIAMDLANSFISGCSGSLKMGLPEGIGVLAKQQDVKP